MPQPDPASTDPLIAAYYGTRPRLKAFDWRAAFIPFWLAWRRFIVTQAAIFLFFGAIWTAFALVEAFTTRGGVGFLAAWLVTSLMTGLTAGSTEDARARRAAREVTALGLEGDAAFEYMKRAGRPSPVAAAVMGTLGALLTLTWMPSLTPHHHHERSYTAAMKADLRNLVTAEESYFADNVRYTTSLQSMNFFPSTGVTVTMLSANGTSWSATATHEEARGRMCGIFVGAATPPIAGSFEGEPKCN